MVWKSRSGPIVVLLLFLSLLVTFPVIAAQPQQVQLLLTSMARKGGIALWNQWRRKQAGSVRLRGLHLQFMPMNGWDCQRCDLRKSTFNRASLRGARLQKADLRLSSLEHTSLAKADLRGADLRGADLRGADLRKARLKGAKLVRILHNHRTRWPAGFDRKRLKQLPTPASRPSTQKPVRKAPIPRICPEKGVRFCQQWKKCVDGEATACVNVARLYLFGKEGRREFQQLAQWATKQCKARNAQACFLLAWLHWQELSVHQSKVQAFRFAHRACQLGEGMACTAMGLLFTVGWQVSASPSRSLLEFRRGCQKDDAHGCLLAAVLLLEKQNASSSKQAATLLRKACVLGSGVGCMAMATGLQWKWSLRQPQHHKALVKGFQRGCQRGRGKSCLGLGLAALVSSATQFKQAGSVLRKACLLGESMGCSLYGVLRLSGLGVPKSPRVAVQAFRRGCQNQGGLSCLMLGFTYAKGLSHSVTLSRDRLLMQQRCLRKQSAACLGVLLTLYQSTRIKRNAARAAPFYQRACHLKTAKACYRYAVLHDHRFDAKDLLIAHEYFGRACSLNIPKACWLKGYYYRRGIGVKADKDKAYAFYHKACSQKLSYGCINMGDMWEKGEGRGKDCRKANALYKKACALGFKPACVRHCR